jgi:predicted PurR-regulated permease PerM
MTNLPVYLGKIEQMLSTWRANYFPWMNKSTDQNDISQNLPSVTNTLWKLGGFSISLLTSFLLVLVLISLTAYMVISPRPLLHFYLSLFPMRLRNNAENAFVKSSHMLIGWMRANLIGGTIEGVSVIIFLNIMNVPGAWVWGVLSCLAQMIPRVGFYILSIPPTLVALAISPMKAFWVFVFFSCDGRDPRRFRYATTQGFVDEFASSCDYLFSSCYGRSFWIYRNITFYSDRCFCKGILRRILPEQIKT